MTVLALPDYHVLPAPLWLLTALHVLTLALHFAAMGCLFGGLMVLFSARLEGGFEHPVAERLRRVFPALMAATVTLGVAPLLFAQLVYGQVLYSAAIVSGWFWLGVPLAAMLAYACLYAAAFTRHGAARARRWLGLALLLMVYVSVTYSSVFALAEQPAAQKDLYAADPSGLAWYSDVGAWIFRWLHMVAGAFTLGGFFLAVLARRDAAACRIGRKLFAAGIGAAFLTGIAHLLTLGDALKGFMRSPGIWGLTVGILAAVAAVPFLYKRRLALSGALLGVGLLGMVVARQALRDVHLEGQFDAAATRVAPQWGVFVLFVVCLLVALGVAAWMLRIFFAAPPPAAEGGEA